MAPARTHLILSKGKPDAVSVFLRKAHRRTPAPSLRMISVILRQFLHGVSRVKAVRLSVLAEVCLGFRLFPAPECRGFFSSSKNADQLLEASSVQMVLAFIFRGLSGRGVKVTTLFHLNQGLRTSGAMSLLSIRLHEVNRHSFTSKLVLTHSLPAI